MNADPFGARARIETPAGPVEIFDLDALRRKGIADPGRLPYVLRVLLENVLRHAGTVGGPQEVEAFGRWGREAVGQELHFVPGRVLLQDLTGVPAIVDLAALRDAVHAGGGDARRVNPLVPVDLVIDHSVQVDAWGSGAAFETNVEKEFARNRERYALLRWAQVAFHGLRVVPPGQGIVHQVNLEYLATVVDARADAEGTVVAFPDTLVGTDSHTTMINGAGVLGWGVGGIEAEAVMLGEPYGMHVPEVIGFRLDGALAAGATATDLVLTVTEVLRRRGVVGKFVEFFGPGLAGLPLADRATIANMAPEYGATVGFFPVDAQTLHYLRATGRGEQQVALVEAYCRRQGLFRTAGDPDPLYSAVVALDLGSVEPSLAGPRRPEDRLGLSQVPESLRRAFPGVGGGGQAGGAVGPAPGQGPESAVEVRPGSVSAPEAGASMPDAVRGTRAAHGGAAVSAPQPGGGAGRAPVGDCPEGPGVGGGAVGVLPWEAIADGAVAIAAITSCTNTSNPSVMVAAGLLAKAAVERGLRVPPYVKTSLAPGSRVVTDYLERAGLSRYLDALGFQVVGYGCTTCIGNSGGVAAEVAEAAAAGVVLAAVLSGNRNFEGRIHPAVRANYLASPPLVVAYALAGTVLRDLHVEALGVDAAGQPVFLRDLWPSAEAVAATVSAALDPEMFRRQYRGAFTGDARWQALPAPVGVEGATFPWDPASTYIRRPPFTAAAWEPLTAGLQGARVLALLEDSITTDHISPAGAIPEHSPAGQYLMAMGVAPGDFNTYGARRGNHEVMMRGTFANIRLRNRLAAGGREGGYTTHQPSGRATTIFDAAQDYARTGTPLLVIAGRDYGKGSSRDWAAKGPQLLGVRAVLAVSFERIHRANLVGMGILPLVFTGGRDASSLGLTGSECYDLEWDGPLAVQSGVRITARRAAGGAVTFEALARLDSQAEVDGYLGGGILPRTVQRLSMGGAGV